MSVHEIAASGFGTGAEAYERARPSYPPDAVAWVVDALHLGAGTRVADVAAGTGKFTRLLVPTGASLVAVEPVAGMRHLLATSLPTVPTTAALAERLPFRDSSLDAITVAQAFHWFDAPVALAEFGRVLPSGGRVALVWNARDRSVSWTDEVWTIIDRVETRASWRDHGHATEGWARFFVETPWFTPLNVATFHHEQRLSRADMFERMRSVSHVAALPPDAQQAVLDDVRAVLDHHPDTVGRDELALRYRVDAFWAERT